MNRDLLAGPAVLIPAAGAATRFGSPKQLTRLNGRIMLDVIVDRALEVGWRSVTVVLGAHADEILASLQGRSVTIVINHEWHAGLGSSIRAGIQSLSRSSAALIWLGDQVGVTTTDLRRLITAWERDRSRIVASSYAGTVGVPAILPNRDFTRLLEIQGDRGAKEVLQSESLRTTLVEMPNAAIDIDTPGDLDALVGGHLD